MDVKKNFKFVNNSRNEAPVLYEDDKVPYWVERLIDTDVGKVRVMKTELSSRDRHDGYKVRWNIGRDNYKVSPGLYAIGNPDSKSNVLVTSNYKFTVDKLRCELGGQNLWIVVLDTKGINVWCAAGKGTFGTTELALRIKKIQLKRVVEHNTIILPQLGASGVAAHVVTKMTGFRVLYGPVRAKDIPEFITNGFSATPEMREVKFDLMDRLVLTPVEIMASLKYIPIIYGAFLVLNLIKPGDINIVRVMHVSLFNSIPYIFALFLGVFLLPILLPYIPFRAFSLKGLVLGLIWSVICIPLADVFKFPHSMLIYLGNTLILTSIASFIGLNFTGSTTYTSLSGVKLETKWTTIISLASSVTGLILIVIHLIIGFIG